MADEKRESANWITPWWFILAVSLLAGLVAGGGALLIDALASDPNPLPRWLSFMIGFVVFGAGTAVQLYLRRRARFQAMH